MLLTSCSDIQCIVSDGLRSGNDPDQIPARVWSLSFKPDQGIGHLFPYINGALDDALWYEKPDHVRFLFQDFRCLLYPERIAAHFFETRELALAFIKPLTDFLNDLDARKEHIQPNPNRIRHVEVLDIYRILPRTNCGKCGYAACMAFAAALARGKATADQCPDLAAPARETALFPVPDAHGHAVSLDIDTRGLRQRIREQERRILALETRLAHLQAPAAKTEAATGPSAGPMPGRTHSPSPQPIPPPRPYAALSPRETEVLALIAQGFTNGEIGGQLFISPHTVKSHMINIFNKFGVCDRTQAAVMGVRAGLI